MNAVNDKFNYPTTSPEEQLASADADGGCGVTEEEKQVHPGDQSFKS